MPLEDVLFWLIVGFICLLLLRPKRDWRDLSK